MPASNAEPKARAFFIQPNGAVTLPALGTSGRERSRRAFYSTRAREFFSRASNNFCQDPSRNVTLTREKTKRFANFPRLFRCCLHFSLHSDRKREDIFPRFFFFIKTCGPYWIIELRVRLLFRYRQSRKDPAMKFPGIGRISLLLVPLMIGTSLKTVAGQSALPATSFLLGGITNAASSATNFLASAVEMPRNLLMNATKMTTNYIDSAASIGLDFKLRRILEKFRSRMQHGFPELGIPILEPLKLHELYLRTRNPEIGNVTLYLDDVTIDRLSSFDIDRARLSLIGPTITVNMSISTVLANGYYNITGIIGDMFPLHGSGKFVAKASDFRIYFKTVLGYSRGMYMKSFDLDFSMDSTNLVLENFMGGDKIGTIMTEVFQDLTPHALEVIKPEILPPIQDFIASRANDTIYHLTMRDVLSFLLGEGDVRNFPLPLP